MEVRGRLEAGGRGPRGLGQRRVRRRCRRRRPARSLRHELGAERAVPQPRRRHVRRRRRPRRASPPAAGARAARSSMPTPTAIWTSTSRATSRRRWESVVARAADAALAQRATHHGRAGRTSRRGRSVLRKRRQRAVRGGHRRARPLGSVARLRLRRRGDRLRRRRVRRSVRGQRLEPELPVSQPRERPLRKRRPRGRRRGQRRRRARRRAWAPTPATTMATARIDLVLTTFAHDRYTLYRNLDGRHFEDASARRASPPRRSSAWAGARPSSTPISTAGSICSSPTATSFRTSIDSRSSARPTAEEPAVPESRRAIPRRVGSRRRRPAARGASAAGSPSGISTTTATSISSSTTWTMSPTLLENRQRTKHHWVAVRAAAPAGNRFAIGARVTVSGGGSKQMREIRSGGSFLSQNDLRAYFGLGDYARSRGRGDPHAGRAPLGMEAASERPPACARPCPTRRPSRSRVAPDESRVPIVGPRRLLLAGAAVDARRRAGTAQVEQSANLPARARGSERCEPFLTTARAGQRWVPAGAAGQGARGAAARVVRRASRGGPQATAAVDSPARSRLPRRTAAADRRPSQTARRRSRCKRATDLPREATLDARAFGAELQRLIGEFRDVTVAEFLITSIEPEGPADPPSSLRTTVRYDIVGGRDEGLPRRARRRVGDEMAATAPRVGRSFAGRPRRIWSAARGARSSPRSPTAALGRIDSFRRQLTIDLDSWMATFDSVLTRDSNGHHGVSVGDADGDGLDDLYVAQPAGLPNRLYRNRGDSHLRGHHRRRGRCRSRRHGTIALRRRRQRRRSGSRRSRPSTGRCSSSTTARAASRPSPMPSASRSRFRAC